MLSGMLGCINLAVSKQTDWCVYMFICFYGLICLTNEAMSIVVLLAWVQIRPSYQMEKKYRKYALCPWKHELIVQKNRQQNWKQNKCRCVYPVFPDRGIYYRRRGLGVQKVGGRIFAWRKQKPVRRPATADGYSVRKTSRCRTASMTKGVRNAIVFCKKKR